LRPKMVAKNEIEGPPCWDNPLINNYHQ